MSSEVLDNEEAKRRGAQNLRERTELTKTIENRVFSIESVSESWGEMPQQQTDLHGGIFRRGCEAGSS